MLKLLSLKLGVSATVIALKLQISFCQDPRQNWTPLRVQTRIQVQMHPWMLVETTRVTESEYYFAYF